MKRLLDDLFLSRLLWVTTFGSLTICVSIVCSVIVLGSNHGLVIS